MANIKVYVARKMLALVDSRSQDPLKETFPLSKP